MNTKILITITILATFLLGTTSSSAAPSAMLLGTAFTYQGRLEGSGVPYNGSCDFHFSLYDAATEGNSIGSTIVKIGLQVTNGLFTTQLDFGPGIFTGNALWLEIAVQCPGDLSSTTFTRQEMTATPYALYAISAPWKGLSGVPAGLNDGDDDTTYSEGDGITLTDTTFSIDPSYTQRRVASSCAAGTTIRAIFVDGDVVCENDDNTLYDAGDGLLIKDTTFSINPEYTQQRVSNSCEVGSSIRAINADGSVECEHVDINDRALPPTDTTMTSHDSGNYAGLYTSITIGSDGLPIISYYDWSTHHLKVAHCNNFSCSGASINTIDTLIDAGEYTSIAIGADGMPVISYYDATNDNLKMAYCTNNDCSNTIVTDVDTDGDVGWWTSITIGSDGYPVISYYDHTNTNLKVAYCKNKECSDKTLSVVDFSVDDVGLYTSLTIGMDGLPIISYYDNTNYDLKVAHCSDSSCSSAIITQLDSVGFSGQFTSITIGADGLGLISYYNGDLKVAHCSNILCNSATFSTHDPAGNVGEFTSITINSDGLGLISYYDNNNSNLKLALCNDITCSLATIITLDFIDNVGQYSSITIGSDGYPVISYYYGTSSDLRVLHCSNPICSPYFRRR